MNVPRTSVVKTVVMPLLTSVLRIVDSNPVRDGRLVFSDSAKSIINWLTPLVPILRAVLLATESPAVAGGVGWMSITRASSGLAGALTNGGKTVSDAET